MMTLKDIMPSNYTNKYVEDLIKVNKSLVEALSFYANKDMWFISGLSTEKVVVRLNFTEHSIDTEWFEEESEQIGGGIARKTLRENAGLK